MPPTRTKNIQGRQKSCSECVKSKRRCDTGQPCCARCIRQSLTCSYSPQPCFQDQTVTHENLECANASTLTGTVVSEATTFPLDLEPLDSQPFSNILLLDFDMPTAISSLNSLNTVTHFSTCEEEQFTLTRSRHSVSTPSSSSTSISPSTKTRIEYAIEQLKLAPRTMVEENSTIWCHNMLYEEYMPGPVQDAHAACALYLARNDVNADFVARHINGRVKGLIAAPVPTNPIEVLARAHALMLYQVMLVFGGDIRLYGQVESLLPHLEVVGNTLLVLHVEQNDPSGLLPLYPSTAIRAAWTSFILRETLRRTILSLFQFIALCGLLREQPSSCEHELVRGNKVTLSAHLWNAKSAFDFGVAWNAKKHFLVKELDFTEVLTDARPDDMDAFAKTILVGTQGIDDTRGWFHMHGATL